MMAKKEKILIVRFHIESVHLVGEVRRSCDRQSLNARLQRLLSFVFGVENDRFREQTDEISSILVQLFVAYLAKVFALG